MNLSSCLSGHAGARLVALAAATLSMGAAAQPVPEPSYAVFLDDYPKGDFYFVDLNTAAAEPRASGRGKKKQSTSTGGPVRLGLDLDLPRRDVRQFQLGNGDIHVDSSGTRHIVFGGRIGDGGSWDIYAAEVDIESARLRAVRRLIAGTNSDGTPAREEDPKFSWDGGQIIYKCHNKICLADSNGSFIGEMASLTGCELWAPALDLSGGVMAYVQRCDGPDSDTIYRHFIGGSRTEVPKTADEPDRFPQFNGVGDIIYSHLDRDAGSSRLLSYVGGQSLSGFYDTLGADDEDPYVFKPNDAFTAFISWHGSGYSLYLVDRTGSVESLRRLTGDGGNVLGPILMR